jgi:DNA polymerase I-like protein with 3'-5' exonuclease and polymerase domains
LELGCKGFLLTPKGKVSMSKESLAAALETQPELCAMLRSRSTYDTLIGTFMEPWVRYADANEGRIHASYNQVRNPDDFGTRTGRLSSSSPNLQNVANNLGKDYFGDLYPEMRSYLLPEEGQVWVCSDAKNQEPRLTAHFEDGALMQAFLADPMLDPYIFVRDTCGFEKTKDGRHKAKQVFLGLVYAMGIQAMADKCGVSYDEGAWLKRAVLSAIPDVGELAADCRKRFKKGLPIRTLGGRLYYCEPPSGGRSFEYKAINTLIQGSAADQTKEAMIYAYPRINALGGRMLGTVHDEISVSVPAGMEEEAVRILEDGFNALYCDVPMKADAAWGANYAEAK